MELNTLQLLQILRWNPFSKKCFIGVFPRDELPQKLHFPCCFIFNTQKSTQKGEHWLALFFKSKQDLFFFDSLGFSPKFYELQNYLLKYSKHIHFVSKPIQSPFSRLCGHYCCFFIISMAKDICLKEFYNFFSIDVFQNDLLIHKLLK